MTKHSENFGVICDRYTYLVCICGTRAEANKIAESMTDPSCINDTVSIVRGLKNISNITGLTIKQIKNRS